MLYYFQYFVPPNYHQYYPLYLRNTIIGWYHKEHYPLHQLMPQLFTYSQRGYQLSNSFLTAPLTERNKALQHFATLIYTYYPHLVWRNELYGFYQDPQLHHPLFALERGVIPLLGLPAYGTHINGYTHSDEGIKIWVARRSKSKAIAPLRLDQMVAGGLSYQQSITENVRREALEEAMIPLTMTKTVQLNQIISYQVEEKQMIRNDRLFSFDLELPKDFIPHNGDGEVEAFYLLTVDELIDALSAQTPPLFKENSALIFIDFLMRHHLIPKTTPHYTIIKKELNRLRLPI